MSFKSIERVSGKQRLKTCSNANKYIKRAKKSVPSTGERIISRILESEGIIYKREYYFTELSVNRNWRPLFFDFYLPGLNVCIEFDGEHHFTNCFGTEAFEKTKRNDFYKTSFCRKMGIPLLRIKYDQNIEAELVKFLDKYL